MEESKQTKMGTSDISFMLRIKKNKIDIYWTKINVWNENKNCLSICLLNILFV